MHIGRYLVLHLAPIYLCIIYYFSSRSFLHGSKCREIIQSAIHTLYSTKALFCVGKTTSSIKSPVQKKCHAKSNLLLRLKVSALPQLTPLDFYSLPHIKYSSTFFRELGCFLNRIVEYLLNEKTLHACFMFFTVSCQASREMTREYNPQPKYI